MSEDRCLIEEMLSSLARQRDELALQIHLGSVEAKDEWSKLTSKFDQLSDQYAPTREAVTDAGANVLEAFKLVAEEMRDGFQKIGKTLK